MQWQRGKEYKNCTRQELLDLVNDETVSRVEKKNPGYYTKAALIDILVAEQARAAITQAGQ